jgi:dolichol-phosphate mannosyltransferase
MSSGVLVVVPTFNEALNLEELVGRLLALQPEVDVSVVDDASPDGTGSLADQLAARHTDRVNVIHRPEKGGRGAAVLNGLRQGIEGGYNHFAEMDADLSHLPEQLPSLLEATVRADIVIGSRYLPGGEITGWSRKRKAWSTLSNLLIDKVLRLPISDYTNGFRVYSRKAVEDLLAADLKERGYISLSEWAWVLHRAGMTFTDVPIRFVNRRLGTSKMSAREAVEALRALFRMRKRRSR